MSRTRPSRSLLRRGTLLLGAAGMAIAATNVGGVFTTDQVRAHEHKLFDFPDHVVDGSHTDGPYACTDGVVDVGLVAWECDGIDLLSYTAITAYGGDDTFASANPLTGRLESSDVWGWTHAESGREFVIIGKTNGAAFFEVTDPASPVHLASTENTTPAQLLWFDIKVNGDFAYIVSESPGHGMQVVDLTRLLDMDPAAGPEIILPDGLYPFEGSAHNVAINTETDFAYLVGSNAGLAVQDRCRSGVHMVDISMPTAPIFAGCYLMDGGPGLALGLGTSVTGPLPQPVDGVRTEGAYVHDTQCVVYRGPDVDHQGKEICVSSAEDRVVIVDVTDKLLPTTIASFTYENATYSHQGWFTEDQRHFLLGDELDEDDNADVTNTTTIIFDLVDLDLTDETAPAVTSIFEAETQTIDHNLYTHQGAVYQSNYSAGLRVSDLDRVGEGILEEVAFFDVFPDDDNDAPIFAGTWSNYPYFASGTVAVSAYDGLYLVKLTDEALAEIAD